MINTVLSCLCTCNSLWQGLTSKMFWLLFLRDMYLYSSGAVLHLFREADLGRTLVQKRHSPLWVYGDLAVTLVKTTWNCRSRPATWQAKLFCATSDHSVTGGSWSQPSGGIHVWLTLLKLPENNALTMPLLSSLQKTSSISQSSIVSLLLPPTNFSGQF